MASKASVPNTPTQYNSQHSNPAHSTSDRPASNESPPLLSSYERRQHKSGWETFLFEDVRYAIVRCDNSPWQIDEDAQPLTVQAAITNILLYVVYLLPLFLLAAVQIMGALTFLDLLDEIDIYNNNVLLLASLLGAIEVVLVFSSFLGMRYRHLRALRPEDRAYRQALPLACKYTATSLTLCGLADLVLVVVWVFADGALWYTVYFISKR